MPKNEPLTGLTKHSSVVRVIPVYSGRDATTKSQSHVQDKDRFLLMSVIAIIQSRTTCNGNSKSALNKEAEEHKQINQRNSAKNELFTDVKQTETSLAKKR